MTPIRLRLPDDAHVVGALYPPGDPRLLHDGMLHVGLQGPSIDVSWYPEHDPQGEYIVTVYHGSWENQLSEPFATRDVREAAAYVERIAANSLVNVPDDDAGDL